MNKTIEHPPRGERSDFLKITITIPGDLLMELKTLGTQRRVDGEKDSDTSALIREAIKDYLNRQTKTCISKDELISKLDMLDDQHDPETAHITADALLLAYINDPDITTAFDEIGKWYA
jgi:metal-responsive CopG/Arc/MetJ family transcriptional regulator